MTENLLADDNSETIDPNKDYFEELVGEGKKFKDAKELAKGKYISDTYITIMEKKLDAVNEDNKKLLEESRTKARLEELIDQMQLQKLTSSEHTPAKEVENKPGIDPEQLENLLDTKVSSKLKEIETQRKQQENYNMVKGKLKEQFGSNYTTVLKEHVEALGLTEDFVNDLARNHPTVLFKTLGLEDKKSDSNFQSPPRSQQRSDKFAPRTEKRTWTYYQNMRKSDPKRYKDPKTTVQMHEDYNQLGSEFEDGDFNM